MREREGTGAASPEDVPALIERGNALVRQGQAAAAIGRYAHALALQPECFEAHANLGSLLLALHRFAEAEIHLRRALAARPDQVPLQVALGNALRRRGDFAQAAACFRTALQHAPGHALQAAAAHYGLGHCLREEGRTDEAADCFERAIAAQPGYVDAHYRLAVLRPGSRSGTHREQLESLQSRVAALPAAQQVRYWFALGRRREDVGAYDAAFAAYAEGNRLQRSRLALEERYPGQEALDARFAERIRETFSADALRSAARPAAMDARVPVFIVGMPRSGTSLLEQMLAAHPALHGGGESRDFPGVLEEAFGFEESGQGNTYPEVVPSLAADALERVGQTYLDRMWRQAPRASHVTDKLTGNFLHAGMIRLALPRAKIIHVARDPRDTCFSCFANLFRLGDIPHSYDLEVLGRQCERVRGLMQHWHAVLPTDAITTVHYEELVADAERVLRRVLAFLGLPWEDRCLHFTGQRRAVRTVSAGQVGRPLYTTSVARWKKFEPHLKPLLDILAKGD